MPELSREDLDKLIRLLETPEMIELLSHFEDIASLEADAKHIEAQIKGKEKELEQLKYRLDVVKKCIEAKSQGLQHQKDLYSKLEKIAWKQKRAGSERGIGWLHANCYPEQFNYELSTSTKYSFALCAAKILNHTQEFYSQFGTEEEYKDDNPVFDKLIEFIERLLLQETGTKNSI